MSSIEINNLSKKFDGKAVIDKLSLEIGLDGITVFMGESGCGKTTLLRIISSLERFDAGEINGVPERISYMFQEDRLLPWYSAFENVKIVSDEVRAKSYLEKVLLENDLDTPVTKLSGGMKRRVALARALAYDSSLVILDEPFKGMDEALKDRMIDLVKEESNTRPFLIVVHELSEAEKLGGKVVSFTGIPLKQKV